MRVVEESQLRPGRSELVDEAGHISPRALLEDDVWLLNYDSVQSFGPTLLRPDWDVVVLDEAQAIKNPGTASSRNARGLKARFAIASTGTPVENRVADLFPLADVVCPGVLGRNPAEFATRFPEGDPATPHSLRAALRVGTGAPALLLRREKNEILAGALPAKRVEVVRLPMSPKQRQHERELVGAMTHKRGGTLELLAQLQKLYQHPALLEEGDSEALSLEQLLAESPKMAWLLTLLREIESRQEKVLVFTLWTRMQAIIGRLLAETFPALGEGNFVINGEASNMKSAHRRIAEVSSRPGFGALILSPLAAGTGLTITAATHVVYYGRWWNPAREDQATDRAHRIGQTKPVTVWIPVLHHPEDPSRGFDVRLHQLVEGKRTVAGDFLAPAALDVTADELRHHIGDSV